MTDFERHFITLPDPEFNRLALRRQRVQSAIAAGWAAERTGDELDEVETWLAGAVQLEQLAAERARVPGRMTPGESSRQRDTYPSGEVSPF